MRHRRESITASDYIGRPVSGSALLLYGDNDVRAPCNVAEDLHAAISGSRLVVLPGAGHICNVEAPEEFNREVRNFLRTPRG